MDYIVTDWVSAGETRWSQLGNRQITVTAGPREFGGVIIAIIAAFVLARVID